MPPIYSNPIGFEFNERILYSGPRYSAFCSENFWNSIGRTGRRCDSDFCRAWYIILNQNLEPWLNLTVAMEHLRKASTQEGFNPYVVFPRDPTDVQSLDINKTVVEGGIMDIQNIPNSRVVAGLLMTFFQELPEPLVPADTYYQMVDVQGRCQLK